MKKFFAFLSAGLLMTACSDDATAPANNGGEQQVTLTFELPEGINSRAANGGSNSALGGASNCEGEVTFTAALYYGENLVWSGNATAAADGNASVTFRPTLVVGETYQLVAYAQLDGVVTDLTNVVEENAINDESVDAYYYSNTLKAQPSMSATLKRATGKLRIIAEDFATAEEQLGKTVESVAITYKQAQPTEFNPKNDTWNTENATEVTFSEALATYTSEDGDAKTILVDYIPATATGEIINIDKVVVTFSDGTTYTKDLSKLDIPVKRNYLTTLTGNFFTSDMELRLEIDDAFDGEEDVNYSLLSAFEFGGEYTLESDVTINSSLILNAGKSLVLDLNGHDLTVTTESTDLEEGDAIIAYGNLTIKGEGTITGNTRAIWARGNDGAVVNIYGGNFIGGKDAKSSVVYASGNSIVNIYGGQFEAKEADKTSFANKEPGVYAALNMQDACTGGINVYGGSFVKQNPAQPGTELASWNTAHPNGFVAPSFEVSQEGDVYTVSPAKVTEATALANILTADAEIISVILDADIDCPIKSLGSQTLGSGEYKLGGENTKEIIIDLNGNTLNITTTYWSSIGAKNADATITIKNGTMTSSQATGTWNSYDVTFANCNYVITDVVFEKAIAFTNSGKNVKINNVTINETHDYYAMWISARGQSLNINGLTVNSAGRAIKIDDEYVDSPALVTLNISNSTFKTAKKSAVIVKSAAGAEINWGEGNDISNVAADAVNAVWVDEKAASSYDLVSVVGATKILEP